MANMTFGVNLIPKTDNTYTLGDSNHKWNIYGDLQNSNYTFETQTNGFKITESNGNTQEVTIKNNNKNLFLNTKNSSLILGRRIKIKGQTFETGADASNKLEATEHGIKSIVYTKRPWLGFNYASAPNTGSNLDLIPGEYYTISFDYNTKLYSNCSSAGVHSLLFRVFYSTSASLDSWPAYLSATIVKYNEIENDYGQVKSGHFVYTFLFPPNTVKSYISISTDYTDFSGFDANDYFEIKNMMLVKGTLEQDYQPSEEDLIIGDGQNLIFNTLTPVVQPADKRPSLNNKISNLTVNGTALIAEHGFCSFITNTIQRPALVFGSFSTTDGSLNGLIPGETYTLSFDYTTKLFSGSPSGTLYLNVIIGIMETNDSEYKSFLNYPLEKYESTASANSNAYGSTASGRCELSFTLPLTIEKLYIRCGGSSTTSSYYASGDFIEMRNIKLEKGSFATPWTPAPQDLSNSINEIKRTYYPEMQVGGINVETGNNYTTGNLNRSRTVGMIEWKTGATLTIANNYSVRIVYFDTNGNWSSESNAWDTDTKIIPKCGYYRLLVKNDSITDFTGITNNFITITDYDNIQNRFDLIFNNMPLSSDGVEF